MQKSPILPAPPFQAGSVTRSYPSVAAAPVVDRARSAIVVLSKRGRTLRALANVEIVMPPRSGLPGSAYTRTATTIGVHTRPDVPPTRRRRLAQERTVAPAWTVSQLVGAKTVPPILVKLSRRRDRPRDKPQTIRPSWRYGIATAATIRSILVRPDRRRSTLLRALVRDLAQTAPRQPLSTTRTVPRVTRKHNARAATVRAYLHQDNARVGKPSWRYGIATAKTIKAILVVATGRTLETRARDRARELVKPRLPVGTTRTVARTLVRPTDRPQTVRALARAIVQTRPTRTGLPASAYTRTTKAILVRLSKRPALERDLDRRSRLVKPTYRQPTVPTFSTIVPILVRTVSRTVRPLDRDRIIVRPAGFQRSRDRQRQPVVQTTGKATLVRALTRFARATQPRATGTASARPPRAPVVQGRRTPLAGRKAVTPLARHTGTTVGKTAARIIVTTTGSATTVRALVRRILTFRPRQGVTELVTIVTGMFDAGSPNRNTYAPGTPTAASYDSGSPAATYSPGSPGGDQYDAGSPSGGFYDEGTPS